MQRHRKQLTKGYLRGIIVIQEEDNTPKLTVWNLRAM